jgi:GMP synthase (glutamine-hydrolysing)
MGNTVPSGVYHTTDGMKILRNFVVNICKASCDWTADSFAESTINALKGQIGNERVILGLSGGVDSSVAAMLLNKAVGENLTCIFVDNGLLRKNEYKRVLDSYLGLGLNVIGVDAGERFLSGLKGITDPEMKRKMIGKTFIEVFEEEAKKVKDAGWLAQGTIYPDVIESMSVNGPSATIKSHHNVGDYLIKCILSVVEPLRLLFKDEVRRVDRFLDYLILLSGDTPFPAPDSPSGYSVK